MAADRQVADKYTGKGYLVWACITQFDAATGDDSFRAQAGYTDLLYWYTDGDNAIFTGDAGKLAAFVQNDVVYMHVIGAGSTTYDTTLGGSTTVPTFQVTSITRKGTCS
jgi:hypothetical protein